MKVALILSGQPRNVQRGFEGLFNSLLMHYDVDVFVHTWFDGEDLSTHSIIPDKVNDCLDVMAVADIERLYKPKRLWVEKPKTWDIVYDFTDDCFIKAWSWAQDRIPAAKIYASNTTNSMFFSTMTANYLKEQYAIDNHIKYDVVIRNRLDYAPKTFINLKDLHIDDSTFYYQDLNQPDGMISDWFAIGSNTSINYYASIYYNIYQLIQKSIKEEGYWCNELLLKHHFKDSLFVTKPVNYLVGS
jgi:hypothetical protein